MSLFLIELVPAETSQAAARALIPVIDRAAQDAGGELVEAQVTEGGARVFAVLDAPTSPELGSVEGAESVSEPTPVRLVGADLDELKRARPDAGYLVEWDIPSHIDMDTYLARKKEKSPKYAEIPEVSFLRTYVREDMVKCLCFYDAPDTDAVVRAREIVSTPIDRLHVLDAERPVTADRP